MSDVRLDLTDKAYAAGRADAAREDRKQGVRCRWLLGGSAVNRAAMVGVRVVAGAGDRSVMDVRFALTEACAPGWRGLPEWIASGAFGAGEDRAALRLNRAVTAGIAGGTA